MLNNIEIWKQCTPVHEVSNTGKVRNIQTKQELKLQYTTTGYLYITIRNYEGKARKHLRVHQLVAKAFIDNPRKLSYVNHIDGNKTNNLLCNLEWCTHSENMKHAWDLGLNKSTKKHKENGRNTIKIAQEIGSKMKRKAIVDVSNGRTFDYVVDAAKYLGVRKQTLTNWLNGHRPNKTTLKYI